ncbi:MAG: DUF3137 domain-containing protein [Alphaproteobacteria bacterium]
MTEASTGGTERRQKLYDSVVAPIEHELLAERETLNTRARRLRQVLLGLLVVEIAAMVGLFGQIDFGGSGSQGSGEDNAPVLFLVAIVLTVIGIAAARTLFLSGFNERLKNKLVPAILDQYGAFAFAPSPRRGDYADLLVEGLLPYYDRLQAEDLVTGTYRGLDFAMVEVKATKTVRSKNRTRRQTVFDGSVVSVALPKPVQGSYFLSTDWHGGLQGLFSRLTGDRIRLESPAFEKLFNFFGDDQIEGRTIMTPARMEQWVAYYHRNDGRSLRCYMQGARMHLALSHASDWLDGSVAAADRGSLQGQLDGLFNDIEHSLSLVDDVLLFDPA